MAKKALPQAERQTLEKLKADIKAKSVGKFYIFAGDEAYLRSFYLQQLKNCLLTELTAEFNFHRFTEENLTPQALADSLEALPMMAERSLVEIDDIDFFALPEEGRTLYTQLLGDIPDYCTVVLVYDAKPYHPDRRKKALAQVLEQAELVAFSRPGERELAQWIGRHFQAHGKAIAPALCQKLIQMTGGDMTVLQSEIEKVAAYAAGPEIAAGDIDAVVEPVLEAVVFDLSNAIAAGRFDEAMGKLSILLQMQQEPLAILGAISSQMRRILTAKTFLAHGATQRDLMSACGMGEYPARKTMEFARHFSEDFCRQAVVLCLETDVHIKTSYDTPQRALELLVLRLAQEARR